MRRDRNAAMTIGALAALAQAAGAAPPRIEVRTPLGGGLTPGCWQPLDVVLTQPADPEAVTGSVHLSLYDPRSQADLGTTLRPVALPAKPGKQTVRFTVFVPEKTAPIATVQVRSGRRNRESLVAERRFEGIPLRPHRPIEMFVTSDPGLLQLEPGIFQLGPDALPDNAAAFGPVRRVTLQNRSAGLGITDGWGITDAQEEALSHFVARGDVPETQVEQWTKAAATPNTEGEGGAALFSPLLKGEGQTPPPFANVALAIGLYLLCLIPLQYALLKRFERREWAWFTTPALVLLFTVGIYLAGARSKSRRIYHNVAAVAEMGAGSERAQVLAGIGVYSTRRARYDIAAGRADALFFSPSAPQAGRREYGSVLSEQGENARAVDVSIPQWAMRLVGVRTHARLGNGVAVDLRPKGSLLVGTVRNDTGFPIEGAQIIGGASLGTLAPGKTVPVAIPQERPWMTSFLPALWPGDPLASKIATEVASGIGATPSPAAVGSGEVILRGWIHGAPVPITVRDSESGALSQPAAQVTLLIVHAAWRDEPAAR